MISRMFARFLMLHDSSSIIYKKTLSELLSPAIACLLRKNIDVSIHSII